MNTLYPILTMPLMRRAVSRVLVGVDAYLFLTVSAVADAMMLARPGPGPEVALFLVVLVIMMWRGVSVYVYSEPDVPRDETEQKTYWCARIAVISTLQVFMTLLPAAEGMLAHAGPVRTWYLHSLAIWLVVIGSHLAAARMAGILCVFWPEIPQRSPPVPPSLPPPLPSPRRRTARSASRPRPSQHYGTIEILLTSDEELDEDDRSSVSESLFGSNEGRYKAPANRRIIHRTP